MRTRAKVARAKKIVFVQYTGSGWYETITLPVQNRNLSCHPTDLIDAEQPYGALLVFALA